MGALVERLPWQNWKIEPLNPEEEACLDRIKDHLREMRRKYLAFQKCLQSRLAKILKMLEKQNKIFYAKTQESTATTTIKCMFGSIFIEFM